MSNSFAPAVETKLDDGEFSILPLVKFDIPGKTVGFHFGGRDFTYSGQIYKPNRWLNPDSFSSALGNDITARTLTFSNVPTDDPDDAIAQIENYNYINAPVTVSYLCGESETSNVLGVLTTDFYEINSVVFRKAAFDSDGTRKITIDIELEPIGRRVVGSTFAKRSDAEQKFDNDATDTFLEYVATSPSWPFSWGQVMR